MKLQNSTVSNRKILGDIGEKIVANHFLKQGDEVYLTENFFGSDDMIKNKKMCQIKVTSAFLKYNSYVFTHESAIKSIFMCDYLYLVTLPMINSHYLDCKILEVDVKLLNKNKHIKKIVESWNFDKKEVDALMINRNSDRDIIKIIRDLTEQEVRMLQKYNESKFRA